MKTIGFEALCLIVVAMALCGCDGKPASAPQTQESNQSAPAAARDAAAEPQSPPALAASSANANAPLSMRARTPPLATAPYEPPDTDTRF